LRRAKHRANNYQSVTHLVQQQTAYWLAGMFNYLKWLLVMMALASAFARDRYGIEYVIEVSETDQMAPRSSSTAKSDLESETLKPAKVARIIESVKDKRKKISDISYEQLLRFVDFEEKNCSPDSFENNFLYHSERKFLSNSNLKLYYDACLNAYKARCKQSLSAVFSKYLYGMFVYRIGEYYIQVQSKTRPTKELLEKLKLKLDNSASDCEGFLVLFKKVEETFYRDRKTILEDLNKQAPGLRAAVEFCESLPRQRQQASDLLSNPSLFQ
jgi:hypothetical protein